MKILVIDDHPLILDALAQLLPQLGRRHRGAQRERCRGGRSPCSTTSRTSRWCCSTSRFPGTRGLDFLADLKLDYPGVPVVVLSATHDEATVMAALGAGAHGFIPKTADAGHAARCGAPVLDGGVYLAPDTSPMPEGDGVHMLSGCARPHRAPDRRAEAPRAGQAEQADLPRPASSRRGRSRCTSARS